MMAITSDLFVPDAAQRGVDIKSRLLSPQNLVHPSGDLGEREHLMWVNRALQKFVAFTPTEASSSRHREGCGKGNRVHYTANRLKV
jgi:hypothetical protein